MLKANLCFILTRDVGYGLQRLSKFQIMRVGFPQIPYLNFEWPFGISVRANFSETFYTYCYVYQVSYCLSFIADKNFVTIWCKNLVFSENVNLKIHNTFLDVLSDKVYSYSLGTKKWLRLADKCILTKITTRYMIQLPILLMKKL